MGQQQLILLVLATVIVGVATVVGIDAFAENADRSNADAMMQDAVAIASDVQAWAQKPEAFGGMADAESLGDAAFTQLGYETDGSGNYTNTNGDFTLAGNSGSPLITGTSDNGEQVVQVIVCGLDKADIKGAVTKMSNATAEGAPTCSSGGNQGGGN
jgi:hypothetical protein